MLDLSLISFALLGLAGGLAGFVDSIAGGGGIITVPALLAVGIPPHLALGTNKLQSCFGSLTAALNYRHGKLVRFREVSLGIGFTAFGAFLGTTTIERVSPELLQFLMPVLLVAIFFYTLFNPRLGATQRSPAFSTNAFYFLFGFGLGFYDGFFGPGTGSFWTIALVLGLGFDLKKATAHTKVLNFTSNIVACATFFYGGHVLLLVGITMGVGQVVGAFLGSRLVLRRDVRFVRFFFLAVVACTITKLIWSTYF